MQGFLNPSHVTPGSSGWMTPARAAKGSQIIPGNDGAILKSIAGEDN
ncbi:hypothetical protein MALG_00155 [Marinovum algicola DG 898]|nr:hypothetical protein MALG_00155 [Marinovum algicola DG 898]